MRNNPEIENSIPIAGERLHKRIAASGLCSRRAAEELIREGRVSVNGDVVTTLGTKVGPEDQVEVDGRTLRGAKLHYLILNKPTGVLTTLSDPFKRKTVALLLPDLGVTLKPAGRLDQDSEGLLLLTNDGELAFRVTHPRYTLEKEYEVVVDGALGDEGVERLQNGVAIQGKKTAPAKVLQVHFDEREQRTRFRIVIHEGRKRQIRLMGEAIGHPVRTLRRVRIGPITLRKLPRGACRALSKPEVESLRRALGFGTEPSKTGRSR